MKRKINRIKLFVNNDNKSKIVSRKIKEELIKNEFLIVVWQGEI